MRTRVHRLIDADRLDERTIKPVVKLTLVVAGLFLLWGLLSNLPGIDAIVASPAITYGAIIGAALTLGIVAIVVHLAMRVEPLVARALAGPADVTDGAASIVKHVVYFIAVVTAHYGLSALIVPLLADIGLTWTYDMLFFVLALVPTAMIAYRFYVLLDPLTAAITTWIVDSQDDAVNESGT